MNKHHNRLLGTLSLPVCGGDLLDGLCECLESAELRVAFEMVSRRSASGKDHRIILVPHSDVCVKRIRVAYQGLVCTVRTIRLGDFRANKRGSEPVQERLALRE